MDDSKSVTLFASYQQPEKLALLVLGTAFEIFIRKDTCFVEFHGKGKYLGSGKGVHAVLKRLAADFPGKIQVIHIGGHGIGQLGKTFHHVGRHVFKVDQGSTLLGTVVAGDEALDGGALAFGPALINLFRPEVPAPFPGVSPGKAFRMPFFIHMFHHLGGADARKDRHHLGDGIFVPEINIFTHLFQVGHKFFSIRQKDRFGAPNRNGFEFFVPHHRTAAAPAGRGAGLLNGGGKTLVFTCTECGRCKDVCPAYLTDKPLNLKDFNDDLKYELFANADKIVARAGLDSALKQAHADEKKAERIRGELAELTCDKTLVGDVIQEDTLWACTTCRACEKE